MTTSPCSFLDPFTARSQTMRTRIPRMSVSSGAKNGRLSKLDRTTEGTFLPASERDLRGPRRADDVEQIDDAAVDQGEEGLRVEAEDEDEHRERDHRRDLPRVDLGELAAERFEVVAVAPLLAELAEEHPLHRPEVVRGGDDDAGRGEDRHHPVDGEGPHERQHLADEARKARQTERRHEGEADER